MKKKVLVLLVFLVCAYASLGNNLPQAPKEDALDAPKEPLKTFREITGKLKRGQTMSDLFKSYGLQMADLFRMREASAYVHKLRNLRAGQPYSIVLDSENRIDKFTYWIDDDTILNIRQNDGKFIAEKTEIPYEKKNLQIGGVIRDNLISSVGEGKENLLLALDLSDIFAWDIDFTSDLRNDDVFKVVVEGLYIDGKFKKYGDILSAEFTNNGKTHKAYRFAMDGKAEYFDRNGNSLKKAFLKAPLNFRRISSGFAKNRFHPVLRIYRPHHGVDYSAPMGTQVSAVGDGTVAVAGFQGQYGKLVVVRHPNGYKTYYGHLSHIAKGVYPGVKVSQGEVIGAVGSTGLATGPHLHYEVRINDRPVDPRSMKIPRGIPVPQTLMAEFTRMRNALDTELALIDPVRRYALTGKKSERSI